MAFLMTLEEALSKAPLMSKKAAKTRLLKKSLPEKVDNFRKNSVSAKAPTKTMLMTMKRVRLKGGVFHSPVDKPLQSFEAQ
jgi:hypothetical protein